MARSKKGTWTLGDTVYWIVFYIPLTLAVIYVFVYVPTAKLEAAVNPLGMDAKIFEGRAEEHLARSSPVVGVENELTSNVEKALQFSLTEKKFGWSIEVGDKKYYGNKLFYEVAAPIAPINFNRYTLEKTYLRQGQPVKVTIDQVYPKQYERFK